MKKKLHPYIFLLLQVFLFSSAPGILRAQSLQDTLEVIDVFFRKDSVTDQRNLFAAGQQVQQIEDRYRDLYRTQSVAELLAQQTPVFIKAYGINSMATLSFRGASAAQSAVLWNGVPILNPALGVADVSLLGTGLFDNISVRYGSSAALFGSGNVGGALQLDNAKADFTKVAKVNILTGAGSYGRRDATLNTIFQNERWKIGLRAFYQAAKNDFPYTDHKDSLMVTENAGLKAGGGIFSADYNLDKNSSGGDGHLISFKLWMQQYSRQIPAALFEQSSVKTQKDASLRSLLSWQRKWTNRTLLYAKASLNREFLRYEDGVVLPDNKNTISQYYQEIGWKWRLDDPAAAAMGKHTILVLLPLQYAAVKGDNLDSIHSQFRPAIAIAYNFSTDNDRLKASFSLRQEWANGRSVPLLPGVGAAYNLVSMNNPLSSFSFTIRANAQRTYRIPTLNELYYFPGGNEGLKPEQGWVQDAGYTLTWSLFKNMPRAEHKSGFSFTHDAALFNRNIKDWIYWLGGAIWTPHNIAEVHSRGLETDNRLEIALSRLKLYLSVRTAYVLSTSEASYLPDDKSKGKQIPYAPRYNGQANIGLGLGSLLVNYNHTYTGYRFVTIDESQYLQPYSLANIQIAYSLIIKDYLIQASAQLQNIWNKDYKVVWDRPMPRRYMLFSLLFGIGK